MQLFSNNADASLNGAIASDTTTIVLKDGEGSKFPSPAAGDYFLVTIFDRLGTTELNHEIVKCTSRIGDVLTVTRAQEGTSAKNFPNGACVELRVTAGTLNNKVEKVEGKSLSTEDFTTAEKSKLGGIASGATANSSDAFLKNRANHTGTQTIQTIEGLDSVLGTKVSDAPSDGKTYGRKDAAWAEVVGGDSAQVGDVLTTARSLTAPYLPLDGSIYMQASYPELYSELGIIVDTPLAQKLTNPATTPTGHGSGSSFSQDGAYLAVAHSVSPFITIYKRSGDTFTKLANPSTLPSGEGTGCAFTPDGNYLAVSSSTSPYLLVYKRSGDVFTKLPDLPGLPAEGLFSAYFDSEGTYLATAGYSSFIIYKRSGDTFTKLTDPAVMPGGTKQACAFSPDGTYLAVAHTTSPYVSVYERSGDTFTNLANPSVLPPSTSVAVGLSSKGDYLAVGLSASPFIALYKRSGGVFTKMANPVVLPGGAVYGNPVFSPADDYLVMGCSGTPFIVVYSRSGDTFTKLPNPALLPPGPGRGLSFGLGGQYLAVPCESTAPYFALYKNTSYSADTQFIVPKKENPAGITSYIKATP